MSDTRASIPLADRRPSPELTQSDLRGQIRALKRRLELMRTYATDLARDNVALRETVVRLLGTVESPSEEIVNVGEHPLGFRQRLTTAVHARLDGAS